MYECFGKGDMATLKTDVFAAGHHLDPAGPSPAVGHEERPGRGHRVLRRADADRHHRRQRLASARWATTRSSRSTPATATLTNGEEIIFPTCSHYTIKDGKIAKVQVYTADQHGVDRYFWAMYDLKPIPDRLGIHDLSNMHDPNVPLRTDKA